MRRGRCQRSTFGKLQPLAAGVGAGANLPHALGIYLIDSFGNRELLYRDPVIGSTNACTLVSRPVPPVLPSQLPAQTPDQGSVLVADVYQGLNGIPRGTVKEIRVIQIFPKTTPVGGTPPIGLAGEENARAVLGEAPVEEDGSVHLTVPARKPILFQLLDENGMACQTMRSLTYLQPGERVSCIGCHETARCFPEYHADCRPKASFGNRAQGIRERTLFLCQSGSTRSR